jgi:DNA-3-methyladenine glycosylase
LPRDLPFGDLPALPRAFYARPTIEVAKALLGQMLVLPPCAGRIVEVEAYLGKGDLAAHSSRGLTERTRVIFGPPGHVYVYFIYGMYECLNLVAEPEGMPGCVLIRAAEPTAGIDEMVRRRPVASRTETLCAGPGRLTRAFGITRHLYGADATKGPLTVRRAEPVLDSAVATGPRIGIRHCPDLPLRFWIRGHPSVSKR